MDRGRLQGALGDALHCLNCAAGYNLRWLMKATARLSIGVVFLGSVAFATDERDYGGDDCQPIKLDGFVLHKIGGQKRSASEWYTNWKMHYLRRPGGNPSALSIDAIARALSFDTFRSD